ncbi:MAG: hypothetical protein H6719_23015 [Sandaracinaceae bacterium]|nr:hypothetical protein [Sandaracinaceae bacterium]
MLRAWAIAKRWLPWVAVAACVLLLANEALAQSTGGSFGGGSFGGGGGGGGGGGYSGGGGGDDGGGDLVAFILYIVFSRLPWPLKIGAIVLAFGVWGAFKLARRRRDRGSDDES